MSDETPTPTPAKPKRHRSAAVVDVSPHLPEIHAAAAAAGIKPADATAQFRGLLQAMLAQAAATLIASFLQQAQASLAERLAAAQAKAAGAGEALPLGEEK